MDEIINLIANVGFPIAVAVYLLIRIETKLNHLTKAIGELREAIITLPHSRTSNPLPEIESYREVQTYADN
ncbi:MAG TPA: YvrJ family protein [Syntrophomonadaceae bacterium]|nr:YvrJ family protein [Syntrophomonadaceae bacterium]